MIIPLLEERVVTQKQLFLKEEELHITKRPYETTDPREVTLGSEEAVVEKAGTQEGQPADKRARRRSAGR